MEIRDATFKNLSTHTLTYNVLAHHYARLQISPTSSVETKRTEGPNLFENELSGEAGMEAIEIKAESEWEHRLSELGREPLSDLAMEGDLSEGLGR